MANAKCSICGRTFYNGDWSAKGGAGAAALVGMVKKPVCPDCKRAGAFSGGGNNGGGSSNAADKAAAKIAEENADRERIEAAKAAHKAAVQEIKNYVFDDSSDEAFIRSVMNFMDDYQECNPGLFADKDYKKAYKRRIENELKLQKNSNPEKAEKLASLWKEASKTMKKRLRRRFVFSIVIIFIAAIGCSIWFTASGDNPGTGLLCGAFFGCIFGSLPHWGIGKKKEDDE